MVGAVSGESVNLTHIAEVLGIGRPFAKHCLETLERFCLVDRIAVWPGSLAFERGVRSPKYVVADSGWLCGLLGFAARRPALFQAIIRRMSAGCLRPGLGLNWQPSRTMLGICICGTLLCERG